MRAPTNCNILICVNDSATASRFFIDEMRSRTEIGRTAVVTGAEGFIGSSLTRELVHQGWDVVALHFPSADLFRLEGVPVSLRPCDIMQPSDLEETVPYDVDAIFHLAADVRITSRRSNDQHGVNLDGTRNVIEAAMRNRARRFLYTSSMASFGVHGDRINETTSSNAMATAVPYFRSKYLGELEVDKGIDLGLDAVIINPANVVGPRDIKNMPAMYIRLVHQKKMHVMGPGQASFCHVEDVARAMVSCVDRGRTGERYLLGGTDASFIELGRIIEDIVGGRAPRLVLPAWAFRSAGSALDVYAKFRGVHNVLTKEMSLVLSSTMLVDSSKAIDELQYGTSTLREMITDEAEWLSEHGLLDGTASLLWHPKSGSIGKELRVR